MTNSAHDKHHEPHFFTGFLFGGALAFAAGYLTMTKSGRKMTHAFLKLAEEWGERGEEFWESAGGVVGIIEGKKEEVKKTVNTIMDKLQKETDR